MTASPERLSSERTAAEWLVSRPVDTPPFVGRTAELDQLGAAVAAARRGTGRLVVVAGEAGVGKTRLMEEFGRRAAAAGTRVVWGSASADGSAPPFWPWDQVLGQLRQSHPAHAVPTPAATPATPANPATLATPATPATPAAAAAGYQPPPSNHPAPSGRDTVRGSGPLADYFADLPEIPELPALLGQRAQWSAAPDPLQARLHLYEALAALLLDLVDTRPTVVLLEDLQRWDVASLQFLGRLGRRLRRSPLLVVATARDVPRRVTPEDTDPADTGPAAAALAAVVDRSATERIALGGLSRGAVEELVAARRPDLVTGWGGDGRRDSDDEGSPDEGSPDEWTDAARQRGVLTRQTQHIQHTQHNGVGAMAAMLHERTGGNPFFVSELLRLVANEPDPVAAVAGVTATPAVRSGRIRQVLRHRLGALPAATGAVLLAAAVAGDRADLPVAAATAGLSEHRFLELAEPALSAGLLGADAPGRSDRLRFVNTLVCELLQSDASNTRRAALHARAGRALLDRPGTAADAEADAARVAHHFFHAWSVVGATDTLHHVLHAADQAERVLAYEDCEVQLRRALRLVEAQRDSLPRASRELSVQMRLGRVLTATRGYTDPAVRATFDRARVLSQAGGHAPEHLPALWGVFSAHHVAARFDAGREVAAQLHELARRSGSRLAHLAASHAYGALNCHLGPYGEAWDHLRAGVALAEEIPVGRLLAVFPHHPGVLMRGMNAVMAAALGDHARARNVSQRAVATAESVGHPFTHILALYFDALVAVLHDDPEWTLAATTTGARLADGTGAVFGGALCAVLQGWAEARLDMTHDDLDRDTEPTVEAGGANTVGPRRIQAALASLRQLGVAQQRPLHYGLLADAWRSAGRTDLARSAVRSGLTSANQSGEVFYVDTLRRHATELHMT